jgi:hypothetical protein
MATLLKILQVILMLTAIFMGLKQGWAMITAKPDMLRMLERLGVVHTGVTALGLITIASALLILFSRTFLYGNFLMAASILFIMALELQHKDLRGVAIEVPFLLLSLVIIYLGHPLTAK